MTIAQSKENPRSAVLLINLGSPAAATSGAVRRYLVEFLSDPRVIDLPRWLWIPLLRLIIAPLRGMKSAQAYQKIWTSEGSPLVHLSQLLGRNLQKAIGQAGETLIVDTAMRYGQPNIPSALVRLEEAGVERVLVLPLYPQYSYTTTATAYDVIDEWYKDRPTMPEIVRVDQYFDLPVWSESIANSISTYQQANGTAELLIFSFHGLPERYIKQGDPYRDQVEASVRDIAAALSLNPDEYLLTFQSRVGAEKWLQPYTSESLERLAKEGVRKIQVVCPGFSIDCLETLEEIAMQNQEVFIDAGGERLDYIPALNDSEAHVDVMRTILTKYGFL